MKPILYVMLLMLAACASAQAGGTSPTESAFEQTKLFPLTAEAETVTAGYPRNDATITAIMETKYAAGTAMAATMTALPTETPVPTIPPESAYCRPQDLKASARAEGATQNIFIGVEITNTGASACFLQKWPLVELVDGQGHLLEVDRWYYTDSGPESYTQVATLQASEGTTARVGLQPGWSAGLSLVWYDWCGGTVPGGAVIRLTLGGGAGVLAIPAGVEGGGTCNDPGTRSSYTINNIEFLPQP